MSSNLDNEEYKTEIIYLRYDDINMNYVYLCVVCNKVWTRIIKIEKYKNIFIINKHHYGL